MAQEKKVAFLPSGWQVAGWLLKRVWVAVVSWRVTLAWLAVAA